MKSLPIIGSLSGNESDISDDVRPANDYYQYSYGYGSRYI